jgi:hypothetical protein
MRSGTIPSRRRGSSRASWRSSASGRRSSHIASSTPLAGADDAPELRWLALAIFACFALGAASGPHPYDVGELASAAALLGGSHAPGQPLHALLGHAVSFVPLGSIAFRVAALSAGAAAIASWAAGRTTLVLAGAVDPRTRAIAALVAVGVALLPAVVRNAMRPEVYTSAFACVMIGAWALAARSARGGPGLKIAAIAAGLAFALHPPHALVLAAMGLVSCALRRPKRAELLAAIGLGLVSLTPLAYLPIRAMAGAPMWGDPTTASGLAAYLTGAAYQRNLGAGDAGRAAQLLSALRYVALEGGGAAVLLAPIAITRRATRTAWALASVAIAAALLQPLEERNPDNVAYFAPALALVIVAGGASLSELARARPALALCAPFFVLAPLSFSFSGGHLASAELPYLETLAFETVDAPSPDALLVARTDFVSGAAMMSRDVDAVRPDLAIFVEGLATSSWHWHSLRGHAPFDGRPLRTASADPRVAFVEGAIGMARGRIEIDAEDAATLDAHGVVRGGLLVALASGASSGVDDASMAERVLPAIVAALAWAPLGDHEAGAQIVRNVVRRRTELLYARGAGATSARELRMASGDALAALDLAGAGPLPRTPAPSVRDRRFFLCSREDLVREAAVVLAAADHPLEATRVLEAQVVRGDDRALLQLAFLQLDGGLVAAARTTLDAYRAGHDGPDPEVDRLEEALRPR